MGTVSLTLPSDGQTIDASDVNNPLNTLAAEINGQLDNSNIKTGAAIDRSKIAGFTDGWESLGYAPTTITALGNRSYTVVIPSVDTTTATSPGQRLKLPRTVTAPTQCADLESGSSQYFSKTSPSGLSFTTAFTCSAWIKLESYTAGGIIARRNADTEGWSFGVNSNGQVTLGAYRIASNNKVGVSYQSVPLNKWVHVAATMDVTSASTSAATQIYIDGVLVPSLTTTTGTATALVQGTTALVIGAEKSAGTNPFDGKIVQAAVYSAILSAATILAAMNQTLTGSETNLASAYTFNGASGINDLSANANNLTAQGSAVATNPDTPFTNPVTGTSVTAGTTNYGIIMAQTFSTNTTYTIQIPEGETLPTTGGIGTVSYSTQKTPYGFPSDVGKWVIESLTKTNLSVATGVSSTYTASNLTISVPVGSWSLESDIVGGQSNSSAGIIQNSTRLNGATTGPLLDTYTYRFWSPGTTNSDILSITKTASITQTAQEVYTFQPMCAAGGGTTTWDIRGDLSHGKLRAKLAYI